MSDVRPLLWLIPALPLLAAVLITLGFTGVRGLRRHAHWPCIIAIAGSFVCALLVFLRLHGATDPSPLQVVDYFTWFRAGDPGAGGPYVDVPFSLRADALTGVMTVMITFIGTLIAIFAAGYMEGDEGYPRFFAAVSLFIFSMTLLVLGNNLVLLFTGWEGVGLCSYLLIGHWFTRPSAAQAARKAFLVTRIGDVGMMVGIFWLWVHTGYKLDYSSIFKHFQEQAAAGHQDH